RMTVLLASVSGREPMPAKEAAVKNNSAHGRTLNKCPGRGLIYKAARPKGILVASNAEGAPFLLVQAADQIDLPCQIRASGLGVSVVALMRVKDEVDPVLVGRIVGRCIERLPV